MEERIKTLEDEIRVTSEELKLIMLDIRSFLMAAQNPFRDDIQVGRLVAKVMQGRG
jgi:hypothetical protein